MIAVIRRAVLSLAVAALAPAFAPAAAQASAPAAPVFRVDILPSPTRFLPGDESGRAFYVITVTNIGGAPTDGSPITVTDVLPAGINLNPSAFPELEMVDDASQFYPCEVGPPVSCAAASTILYPGMQLNMNVPVTVSASASGEVINQVEVSGGGAPDVSAVHRTPISSQPIPFGFEALHTSFLGPDGAPFTQAGGHPYQFHTDFKLNSAFDPKLGAFSAGTTKDVIATLPRGVIVNPNSTPERCTEVQFEASLETECPDGSAVGVVHAILNPLGYLSPDTAPLYNMVPPPGYAAAFGFNPVGIGIFVHLLGGVNSAGEFELAPRPPRTSHRKAASPGRGSTSGEIPPTRATTTAAAFAPSRTALGPAPPNGSTSHC